MTLKEFAKMLDGREYRHEITKEEEALAKELGFVVVFGYSDDNAELRGATEKPTTLGVTKHRFHETNYAWSYKTSIPHETFRIYEDGDYWCLGIVCDINKPKQTNADRIRAMSDEELYIWAKKQIGCGFDFFPCGVVCEGKCESYSDEDCKAKIMNWLKQTAEE